MADFETLLDDVLQKLPLLKVTQLEECCTQLAIEIPQEKKGKKTAIRSLVLNHLSQDNFEEEPDVVDTLSTMKEALDKMLKPETNGVQIAAVFPPAAEKKADVKVEPEVAQIPVTTNKIELARFREWKVAAGTFGGESHVDYCSLCYQIEEAKQLNYSSREIVSGIIKALKDPLRKNCQGNFKWTLEALLKRIRSYAKVKNASDMLDEMKACSQEPNQREIDFLTKMCTYRDNILAMTKQEEHPMDVGHVQKQFCKALAVGFKKDTIRLMLAPIIKKGDLDDDALMTEVNDAVDADKENRDKTKGKSSASSNNLNAGVSSESSAVDNSVLLRELRALAGTVKDLSGLKDTVQLLEGRVNSLSTLAVGDSGKTPPSNSVSQTWIKCNACNQNNVPYCDHCNYCGEPGHKRKNCDKVPPKNV